MGVKSQSIPTKNEVRWSRNLIRRSWSREERDERRRIAAARQQFLFDAVLQPHVTAPARVA